MLNTGELPDVKFIDHLRSELQKLAGLSQEKSEPRERPSIPLVSAQSKERLNFIWWRVVGGSRGRVCN